MKKLTFLAILAVLTILFTNCEEEETTKVDFNIVVTGESPNAIVQITNTSDSADIYTWEFSEGANMETSEEVNPQLLVDKTGEFSITLTATIGKNEISKTKKVTIQGFNGIKIVEGVVLGINLNASSVGNFFSCETGLTYIEDDVNNTIGAKIDFITGCNTYIQIYSPSNYLRIVPSGMVVRFNPNSDNSFTVADFNSMQDDELLLNFANPTEPIIEVHFDELPKVVIMKDQNGKWGAIKVKEYLTDHFIVDVKKQKYVNE